MGRGTNVLLISCAIVHLSQLTQAGPLKRSGREIREIYPEIDAEKLDGNHSEACIVGDVVYAIDEEIPSEQPCLKCKCQPPGVHCETTRCVKKPGCRAIHKPNQCCPDYQCECEHKGRTYANGERLETVPGGECKVCYCRGGEVQCADVSCYIRTDCEGRTVVGQCCPKYDHCPPKAPILDANQSLTTSSEKITESNTQQTVTTNGTNENEIETTPSYEREIGNNKIDILNGMNVENPSTEYLILELNETQDDSNKNQEKQMPEITIREIIPEIKEIPITSSPKREILVTHLDDNIQNNDLLDTDTESSEILENYQPPPVLRIGDKLLFLKKGEFVPEKDVSTPSPVITIIGAEGLQRGFEESLENHEFVINENLDKNNSATDDDDIVGSESVLIEEKIIPTKESNLKREINATINLPTELKSTAETYSIKEKDINETLNDAEKQLKSSTKLTLPEENLTSIDIDNTTIDIAVEMPTLSLLLLNEESSENNNNTTTTETYSISSTSQTPKEVDEYVENPEYPPLPDVMNPPNVDEATDQLEQIKQNPETITITPKILPDVLEMRSNKTIINATNSEWLKTGKVVSLVNQAALLHEDILSQVAPSDLEAMTEEDIENATQISSKINPENMSSTNIAHLVEKYATLADKVEKLKEVTKLQEDVTETSNIVQTITGISTEAKSTETLEESSSENVQITTPTGNKESMLSGENASLEPENISIETETSTKATENINITNVELSTTFSPESNTTFDLKDMVEMLPEDTPGIPKDAKTMPKDVEFIQPINESSSTEQIQENKIRKRKNEESEDIFKELNDELDIIENSDKLTKSPDDEKKEAELIFKELLDEVDGTKKLNNNSNGLQKVNNVIAKYNTRETKQSLDSSLLGILKEFINSQLQH